MGVLGGALGDAVGETVGEVPGDAVGEGLGVILGGTLGVMLGDGVGETLDPLKPNSYAANEETIIIEIKPAAIRYNERLFMLSRLQCFKGFVLLKEVGKVQSFS
jgi:hypothetical protein